MWDLWTTTRGIESWWAAEGFAVEVRKLELEPGGELIYVMTATGPEQVAFMENADLPPSTESRKRFTEVDPFRRLGYLTLADFIPGVEPYETLTVVDFQTAGLQVHVVMTMEPMHDEVWTQRLVMGRENELA